MVTKIISTAKSAAKCLDYNEEKAGAGEAFVVMTNVLESDDLTTVYDTFEAYETNPRIDERTTNTGFHLAVNPGPTDSIDENGIKGNSWRGLASMTSLISCISTRTSTGNIITL